MRKKLLSDYRAGSFSPLIDVVFNAMAAMLIILFVYMVIFHKPPPGPVEFLKVEMPDAAWDLPYAYAFPVVGGSGNRTFSVVEGQFPDGLQFDTALGLLTGAPSSLEHGNSTRDFEFTVSVTDGETYDTTECTLTVFKTAVPFDGTRNQITIQRCDSLLPVARVGMRYEEVIGATGGIYPHSWKKLLPEQWPPGLALEEGRLVGTPTTPGIYELPLQAAYSAGHFDYRGRKREWSAGTAEDSFTLTVVDRLDHRLILSQARVGRDFFGVVATRNQFPNERIVWDFSVPGLVTGDDGTITGSPSDSGMYSVAYYIVSNDDTVGSGNGLLRVSPDLPDTIVGGAVFQCWANDSVNYPIPWRGLEEPVSILTTDPLPKGLEIVNGRLSGVPTELGMYSIKVIAEDATGFSLTGQMDIRVGPRKTDLNILAPDSIFILTGQNVKWYPAAIGGEGHYHWSIKGKPLSGLAFENSQLSGVTSKPSSREITLSVDDILTEQTDSRRLVLTAVSGDTTNPVILTRQIPKALVDEHYRIEFAATGGIGRLTWNVTLDDSLPPGMNLTDHGLQGKPSEEGSTAIRVRVEDEMGQTDGPYSLQLESVDPKKEVLKRLREARDSIEQQHRQLSDQAEKLQSQDQEVNRLTSELEQAQELAAEWETRFREFPDSTTDKSRSTILYALAVALAFSSVLLIVAVIALRSKQAELKRLRARTDKHSQDSE